MRSTPILIFDFWEHTAVQGGIVLHRFFMLRRDGEREAPVRDDRCVCLRAARHSSETQSRRNTIGRFLLTLYETTKLSEL